MMRVGGGEKEAKKSKINAIRCGKLDGKERSKNIIGRVDGQSLKKGEEEMNEE